MGVLGVPRSLAFVGVYTELLGFGVVEREIDEDGERIWDKNEGRTNDDPFNMRSLP
jgi:hypothetical protein